MNFTSNPDRQLVFAVGDGDTAWEIPVTYTANTENVDFEQDNITLAVSSQAGLADLTFEDYMVLRLYQTTDKPNVLWQYAGMNIDLSLQTRKDN